MEYEQRPEAPTHEQLELRVLLQNAMQHESTNYDLIHPMREVWELADLPTNVYLNELAARNDRFGDRPRGFERAREVYFHVLDGYGTYWELGFGPFLNPYHMPDMEERQATFWLALSIIFSRIELSETGNTRHPELPTPQDFQQEYRLLQRELLGDEGVAEIVESGRPYSLGNVRYDDILHTMLAGQIQIGDRLPPTA